MEVIANLATSLDGKIATAHREFFPLGTQTDWAQMIELRATVDAVIFGAATLRAFRGFCGAPKDSPSQPANVVMSSKLEGFSLQWPFFKEPTRKRILVVTSPITRKAASTFGSKADLVRLKPGPRLAIHLLKELKKRGMKRVLIEGGGSIMWEFARHNLIDEYHVTLTPRILGGAAAPTLVDGDGFNPKKVLNLKLIEARPIGDELYLLYRKTARRGA